MAWVKLDDQFFFRPRSRDAGKDGRALFFAGLCYCACNKTDGSIKASALPLVAGMAEVEQDIAHLLVDIGLWQLDGPDFVVVDYLKFNPSRAQLEADAAAAAERQSRARSRRDSQRDVQPSDAVSSSAPLPPPLPVESSSSSPTVSSDSRPDLWTKVAERRLQAAQARGVSVANPGAWKRKVAANARDELTGRLDELNRGFDLTESQLLDVLLSESNPPWLINCRKQEAS